MPPVITAAGQFWEYGDSITAQGNYWWPHVATGLVDQINAKFVTPAPAPNYARSTGAAGVATGNASVVLNSTPVTKVLNEQISINSAQSGWTTVNLLAALPGVLAASNPATILMLIGINDIMFGESEATYAANMNAILDDIHASAPACQVILLSILAHFEQWDNVTGWNPGPNVDDAAIATFNSFLATIPGSRSYVTYVDVRTPLLAAEKINNTAPVVGSVVGAQSGVYTDSTAPAGIHPLTNLKLLMASAVMAQMTVMP
jgi:lysophospholipase L1-like esterase